MDTDIKSCLSEFQRQELAKYNEDQCREGIKFLEKRIRQLTNADYKSFTEKNILDLGLSTRAMLVLGLERLNTVGDILNFGLDRIEILNGCGIKTAKEIKEAVLRDMPEM